MEVGGASGHDMKMECCKSEEYFKHFLNGLRRGRRFDGASRNAIMCGQLFFLFPLFLLSLWFYRKKKIKGSK